MTAFLKWAGSKRQLVPQLLEHQPKTRFDSYYEPMAGALVFFFALQEGRAALHEPLPFSKVVLNDINIRLMEMYVSIQENPEAVIQALEENFNKNEKEFFYEVRDSFNKTPPLTLMEGHADPVQAARFIYLNRLGFNGLYRENKNGAYNVPFGTYKNPKICNRDAIRAASKALQGVDLRCEGWDTSINDIQSGDLVYFDPPYIPVSDTANFTSFNKEGFGEADQVLLAETCKRLASEGVHVMVSNSDTPLTRDLYQGFTLHEVEVRRSISSKGHTRGRVTELLMTSY